MSVSAQPSIVVFGEVLFDCFPGGENVLGGAPFNVAWHLQAFGDQPYFVSSVGNDELGARIRQAMTLWGMSAGALQQDALHPTGQVQVSIIDNEPQYTITPDSAYDFIDKNKLSDLPEQGVLYHGSLALRQATSREAFEQLTQQTQLPRFLDVNLRSPWWNQEDVLLWLSEATWAKLNEDELFLLYGDGELSQRMEQCLNECQLDWLVVTRGAHGAVALTKEDGFLSVEPEEITNFVDTVGAGDAFTSVLLHGLLHGWPLAQSLQRAQQFASAIVGHRGATPMEKNFYYPFVMGKS